MSIALDMEDPCACGDEPCDLVLVDLDGGRPPRVRGRVAGRMVGESGPRKTPARAGTSLVDLGF